MRALLLFTLVCSSPSTASKTELAQPPPLPRRTADISPRVWSRYVRTVVSGMFPSRTKLSDHYVYIIPFDVPFATAHEDSVAVSTRMIRAVADEYEFAGMVAHETAHRLLRHRNPVTMPPASFTAFLKEQASGRPVVDEHLLRRNESEADFLASLITPQPTALLSTLERISQIYSAEQFTDTDAELLALGQRVGAFRIRALRNLLKDAPLPPVVPARPIPGPLPASRAGPHVWAAYADAVLRATYPNYGSIIDRVRIIVDPACESTTILTSDDGTYNEICLHPEVIRDAIHSPTDFAALLGHELGHTATERERMLDYLDTDIAPTKYEIQDRDQAEADIFAILPIARGECVWGDVLERLVEMPRIQKTLSPQDVLANTERIAWLRKACSMNY